MTSGRYTQKMMTGVFVSCCIVIVALCFLSLAQQTHAKEEEDAVGGIRKHKTVDFDLASEPYAHHSYKHGAKKTIEDLALQMKQLHRKQEELEELNNNNNNNIKLNNNNNKQARAGSPRKGGKKQSNDLIEINNLRTTDSNKREAQVETQIIARGFADTLNQGHLFTLNNPSRHFSVYEPANGCGNGTTIVRQTAVKNKCIVATNAGFFNTHTGDCLGNLISDGRAVQIPGTHNVNFGITKDQKIIVGYIDKDQIRTASAKEGDNDSTPQKTKDGKPIFQFETLIAGVVWLVRNGENYVKTSAALEDMRTQETGPTFTTVRAGRMALAHDAEGRIMLFEMDGDRQFIRGPNLDEMARTLISFGAVNAINLDGGGSTTAVHNLALVNYVSDGCHGDDNYRCERPVTSITCFHDNFEAKNAKDDEAEVLVNQQKQKTKALEEEVAALKRELQIERSTLREKDMGTMGKLQDQDFQIQSRRSKH